MAHRVLVLAIVAAVGMVAAPLTAGEVVWGVERQLTTHSAWSYVGYNNARSIATSGDDVHVVMADNRVRLYTSEIMYLHSGDNGTNWDAETRISFDASASDYPAMAVAGADVHIVWQDERDLNAEIYYRVSHDNWVSWEDESRLTMNPARSALPAITATGELVHLVWEDDRSGRSTIYYAFSEDAGLTWEGFAPLTEGAGQSNFPSIVVEGSTVYVVWQDNRDGNTEVFLKRSEDGGVSWGPDRRVTANPARSENPSIAVQGSEVYVTWTDTRDDAFFEVYCSRSLDGGETWEEPQRLSHASGQSYNPSIAVSGPMVHVLWHDERDGNPDIYYAASDDGGASWWASENLSLDPDVSYSPFVAVDGWRVHVIWQDGRSQGQYNHDIFYRRGWVVAGDYGGAHVLLSD